METNDRFLAAAAYHEAGHAIASRFVSQAVPVEHLIIPDTGTATLGRCRRWHEWKSFEPSFEVSLQARARIESRIITLFAGDIAERRFTRRKAQGISSDVSQAMKFASGKELEAYTEWLRIRTENLFDRFKGVPWKCVQALAEKLMVDRKLPGKEVQLIINEVFQEERRKR
jgi:hypothetical protein